MAQTNDGGLLKMLVLRQGAEAGAEVDRRTRCLRL